jgi:hypothetical protein
VFLKTPIAKDMPDLHSLRNDVPRHENRAVTIERLLLRTHQSDAILLRAFAHTIQTLLKELGSSLAFCTFMQQL